MALAKMDGMLATPDVFWRSAVKKMGWIVTLLFAFGLTGCGMIGPPVKGSGELVTVDTASLTAEPFDSIDISSVYFVKVRRGERYSMTLHVDKNIKKFLHIKREGKTLVLGLKPATILGVMTIKAEITLPTLTSLSLSDSATVRVLGFSDKKNLALKLSGSSRLFFDQDEVASQPPAGE